MLAIKEMILGRKMWMIAAMWLMLGCLPWALAPGVSAHTVKPPEAPFAVTPVDGDRGPSLRSGLRGHQAACPQDGPWQVALRQTGRPLSPPLKAEGASDEPASEESLKEDASSAEEKEAAEEEDKEEPEEVEKEEPEERDLDTDSSEQEEPEEPPEKEEPEEPEDKGNED